MVSSRGFSQPLRDELSSLMSPALAGGFFTISATWEACGLVHQDISVNYNCQLPSASTRIKSCAAAAADLKKPPKAVQGGEQK